MRNLYLLLSLLLPPTAVAQDGAHWGIQGDYFTGEVPRGIVELFDDDLPEIPKIEGKGYSTGAVRFHANGSPNWSVEYTRTQFSMSGARTISGFTQQIIGNGDIRGGMVTKFWNFLNTRFVSAGIATGGGVAQTQVRYVRYQTPPGVFYDATNKDWITPTFQALVQADVRPVRWVSLSPFYGMRNGVLGFGGAVRIHFTR
jgi:hypothetical protein